MIYRYTNIVFILTILLVADQSFGQENKKPEVVYELPPYSVDAVGVDGSTLDIIKSIDELAERLDRIEQLLKENNEGSSGGRTNAGKTTKAGISIDDEDDFKLLILNALAASEGLNKKGTDTRLIEAYLGKPEIKGELANGITQWRYQFDGRRKGEVVLREDSRTKTVIKIDLDDSLILESSIQENLAKLASIGAAHGNAPSQTYSQKWLNINNWRKIVPSKTRRDEVLDLIGEPTYVDSNDWYYDGVEVRTKGKIVWYDSQKVMFITEPKFKQ